MDEANGTKYLLMAKKQEKETNDEMTEWNETYIARRQRYVYYSMNNVRVLQMNGEKKKCHIIYSQSQTFDSEFQKKTNIWSILQLTNETFPK